MRQARRLHRLHVSVPVLLAALLAALIACVACPGHAADGLQQTTIAFYANGTVVGGLVFPIGVPVPVGAVAHHTKESGGNAEYSGNVEGSIKLPGGQRVVVFGDEVRVATEAVSPERDRAVHDLEAMWLSDQSLRGRPGAAPLTPEESRLQTAIDGANTRRLAEIIDRFGWPGVRFAGAASQGAFMVLQHADPVTQRRYLPALRDAVARHDAMSAHLALLEDRVRVGLGPTTNIWYAIRWQALAHRTDRR